MEERDRQIAALHDDFRTLLHFILSAVDLGSLHSSVRKHKWLSSQEDMPRHPDA